MQINNALKIGYQAANIPAPYPTTAPPSPTAAAINLLNLLKIANAMSHPLFNPYASGNQSSTQGPYGLSSMQAERDPRKDSPQFGPGSSFCSSAASSATPANAGETTPSPLAQSVSYRPEQSWAVNDKDIERSVDMHISRARDVTYHGKQDHQPIGQSTLFTSTQRDDILSSGTGTTSSPIASTPASLGHRYSAVYSGSSSLDWFPKYKMAATDDSCQFYSSPASSSYTSRGSGRFNSSSGRERDVQSIPGLGDFDYPVQVAPSRPKYTPECASNILSKFGLEKEDLEYLISYPDDQMTPANLPFILHQIRIDKAKRATTAVESNPDPETPPIRGVSGMGSLSSSGGSAALLQPPKVVDYGHTGNYAGGVVDEIGRTSGRSADSDGSGSLSCGNTWDIRSRHSQEQVKEDTKELKSSAPGSSHGQCSSVTNSSYNSTLSSVAARSNHPAKPLKTKPMHTPQKVLCPSSLPRKDKDGGLRLEDCSKSSPLKKTEAERSQSASNTQPSCGLHPDLTGLVLIGTDSTIGAKTHSTTPAKELVVHKQTQKRQNQKLHMQEKQVQKKPVSQMEEALSHLAFSATQPSSPILNTTDASQTVQPSVFIPCPAVAPPASLQLVAGLENFPWSRTQHPAQRPVSEGLPTPSMMRDYAAATPQVFPHTCSLCYKECAHMKDWVTHQNTSLHLESRGVLRAKYPEWNGGIEVGPSSPSRAQRYGCYGSPMRSLEGQRRCFSPSRRYDRRSSPRRSGERRYSPRRSCEIRSPPRTSHDRRSLSETSLQRTSSSAEKLVKKLLEESVAHSVSKQSDSEAVGEIEASASTKPKALVCFEKEEDAEKLKSIKSIKGIPVTVGASVREKNTPQRKTPPREPDASGVSERKCTKSTKTMTHRAAAPTLHQTSPDRSTKPLTSPDRPTKPLSSPDRPTKPLSSPDRPTKPPSSPDRPTKPLTSPDRPSKPFSSPSGSKTTATGKRLASVDGAVSAARTPPTLTVGEKNEKCLDLRRIWCVDKSQFCLPLQVQGEFTAGVVSSDANLNGVALVDVRETSPDPRRSPNDSKMSASSSSSSSTSSSSCKPTKGSTKGSSSSNSTSVSPNNPKDASESIESPTGPSSSSPSSPSPETPSPAGRRAPRSKTKSPVKALNTSSLSRFETASTAIIEGSTETTPESAEATSDHRASAESITAKTVESSETCPPAPGSGFNQGNTRKDLEKGEEKRKDGDDPDKRTKQEDVGGENDLMPDSTHEQMDDGDRGGGCGVQLPEENLQVLNGEKEPDASFQAVDAAGQEERKSPVGDNGSSVQQLSEEGVTQVSNKPAVEHTININPEANNDQVLGRKRASRGIGCAKKRKLNEEEDKMMKSAESCKASRGVDKPHEHIPKDEEQPLNVSDEKASLKDLDSDVTKQETFEALDSIDDQRAMDDDGQKVEPPTDQMSKDIKGIEVEGDANRAVDSVADADNKDKTVKRVKMTPRRDDGSWKRSGPRTRASKREEKEKSPLKPDGRVIKSGTRTKTGTTAGVSKKDQEIKEEVYEILDSVDDEPVRDATERSVRRRSQRGKKEEKTDEESLYEVLDSVEDEAATEQPTVMTRSTRGRRGRTSKKDSPIDKTKEEDTPTRRSRTPARESQEAKKSYITVREVRDEDATFEILDSVEDEAVVRDDRPTTGGRGKRGRPTKAVKATKKERRREKEGEEEEVAVDTKELVTVDEVGADEAGKEMAAWDGKNVPGDEEKVEWSTLELRPPSKEDESVDSLNPETSLTLDEPGDDEEEKKTRKHNDVTVVSKRRRRRKELVGPEAKRSRSQSPRSSANVKLPPFIPNNPLGQEFVVPKSGYFCNLCRVFYLNQSSGKEQHCVSQRHYDNLQKHYQKLQDKPSRSSTQYSQGVVSD